MAGLEEVFWIYSWLLILAIFGVALWGVVRRPNALKKVLCLTIITDTSYLVMNLIGYRFKYPVYPPIIPSFNPSKAEVAEFVKYAVDPVPPTLTITAVVINLAITVLLVFIVIQMYRVFGTLDCRVIARLRRGGEGE